MTTNHKPPKVKIRLNDETLHVPAGDIAIAELKAHAYPPIPADHEIWISVDGAPNIELDSNGTVHVVEDMALYSQSPDGAAHPHRTPILLDGHQVTSDDKSVTGSIIRNLVTPPIGPDRDLFRDIDGAPDERIDDDEVVTLVKGAEFYSVPNLIAPGGGLVLRPEDQQYLDSHDIDYEVIRHGNETHLILREVGLPPGLEPRQADVLIVLPPLFNDLAPDMFWCHPGITVSDGPIPGTGERWEIHVRSWQRWSRHIAGQWRPGIDNLATYIAYIKRAIAETAPRAA